MTKDETRLFVGILIVMVAAYYIVQRRNQTTIIFPHRANDPTGDNVEDLPEADDTAFLGYEPKPYTPSHQMYLEGSPFWREPVKPKPRKGNLMAKRERAGTLDTHLATYNVLVTNSPDKVITDLKNLSIRSDAIMLSEFSGRITQPVRHALKLIGWDVYHGEGETAVAWNTKKYDVIKSGSFLLSPGGKVQATPDHPKTDWFKQYANWVLLQDKETGRRIRPIAIHFIPSAHQWTKDGPLYPSRTRIWNEQMHSVLSNVRKFTARKHRATVFVGGDYNADPHEQVWKSAELRQANLRGNWDWLGTRNLGHGTMGRRFIDTIISPITWWEEIKVVSQTIWRPGHSDHDAAIVHYRIS